MARGLMGGVFGLLALAGAAFAQGGLDAVDVILGVQNGRVVTGRIETDPVTQQAFIAMPRWVVGGTFGDTGVPNATTNPGFDSPTGTFTPGQLVGVTARRALRKWNGSDFSTVPAETLRLTKGTRSVTLPGSDPAVCGSPGNGGPSLTLAPAGSTGKIHEHPGYVLQLAGGTPSVGVYAVELEVWIGAAGGGASLPMWVILNNGADAATFDAALVWADANLPRQNACPANCDGSATSPALTPADFSCFLAKYRAGDCFANCDGSTESPALTPGDFSCFLAKYRAGCS